MQAQPLLPPSDKTPYRERLRDYQRVCCKRIAEAWKGGNRSVLLQLPTGAGKTVIAGAIMEAIYNKGKRSLVLVHRRELIKQFVDTLHEMAFQHDIGVVAAGYPQSPWARVQVASVQTLARRLHLDLQPDFIFVDEAHHVRAKTWETILSTYSNALRLGMTATPRRLDGRGMGQHFEILVEGPPMKWLIEHGFLSPYRMIAPGVGMDLENVRSLAGDYSRHDLDEKLGKNVIADCVHAFVEHVGRGRKTILFGWSVKQSKMVVDMLKAQGYRAEHIDAKTPPLHRDRVLHEFSHGTMDVIANVDIISEGFDCPGADTIVMSRPTQSITIYLQQIGRALRPVEGKTALIVDLCDNVYRDGFGLPDTEREWSLDDMDPQGKGHAKKGGNVRVCQAPGCAFVFRARYPACPKCGHVYQSKRRGYTEHKMELKEVRPEHLNQDKPNRKHVMRQVFRTGGSREKIEHIRKQLGYREGWTDRMLDLINRYGKARKEFSNQHRAG